MRNKGAAVMISHARNAYFAIVANVLSGPLLSGKPQGKRGSLFDACAPRGGHDAGEPAASSGHRAALRSQNALAAFPESARAYPAAGHAPGRRSTRDRATNICWRLLVRTMPGAKLHRPEGAGRSSASFQGGDFEGSKNLDPEKIRCGVNFPSGGIARICVGRHSGIDADSDTWHQRAGADVPHG
jgi:hypothetical protein